MAAPAMSAEVAGIAMDDKIRAHGADLVLSGAGIRKRFLFDVYAIGLYLQQKAADAAGALSSVGPKRVELHMLRDVGAEQFTQALVDGLRANHEDAQYRALEPRAQQLAAMMAKIGQAKKGMRIVLDWTGAETLVLAGGKPAGSAIPGEDFYQALLRIWLGDKPVQEDLKLQLLGKHS